LRIPPLRRPLPFAVAVVAVGAALLCACSVPVAGGLDDSEANRVFVALDRSSVEASKETDPTVDGKWRVTVMRDDLPRALSVLRAEDLPRSDPPTVLDSMGKGALVPSELAEHAQLVAGMAGELERSLEGVEGILRARVHLNVPAPSALRPSGFPPGLGGDAPLGSASVLIEHRGAIPPISADAVQRLVAGGVPGLLPTDVAVVMVAQPGPAPVAGDGRGPFGPLGAVASRGASRELRAALVTLIALVAVLACLTLVLYTRLSRLKGARAELARDGAPGA
jgi:type III secretion protein J